MPSYAFGAWFAPRVQYFHVAKRGAARVRVHDAPGEDAVLRIAPNGDRAILRPFVADSASPAAFGLVDMRTGRVERLLGPRDSLASGSVEWSPDAKKLIVGPGLTGGAIREVDLATRQVTPIVPSGSWTLLGWDPAHSRLWLVRTGFARDTMASLRLATIARQGAGWGPVTPLPNSQARQALNARYAAATNGRIVVGVKDTPG